jgi:hypothetical protein
MSVLLLKGCSRGGTCSKNSTTTCMTLYVQLVYESLAHVTFPVDSTSVPSIYACFAESCFTTNAAPSVTVEPAPSVASPTFHRSQCKAT